MSPAPPADAKKTNGCLIALFIVGGLLLLVLGAAAIGLVIFARSETGKKIASVASKGGKILKKSVNAPGTAELVKLGCAQAMVIDPDDFSDIVGEFVDGGIPKGKTERMVICQAPPSGTSPTCDEVAKTYVAAVGASESGFVFTSGAKGKGTGCQAEYDGAGNYIRELAQPGQPGTTQ